MAVSRRLSAVYGHRPHRIECDVPEAPKLPTGSDSPVQAVDALGKLLDEPLKLTLEAARAEETDEFVLNQYRRALDRH